jgi:hypothetical protein
VLTGSQLMAAAWRKCSEEALTIAAMVSVQVCPQQRQRDTLC